MKETSTKPYLLRAIHEWCTDNGYTPHLAVVVDANTRVPVEHVRDGQIILNVGTMATHNLVMGNEFIEFQARFGGVARQISVPIDAVQAIYARETGQGMAFEFASDDEGYEGESDDAPEVSLAAVPSIDEVSESVEPTSDEPRPPPGSRKPFLKVVK